MLPPVLVIDAASHGITRWLGPIFGLLQEEAASQSPGGTAVLAKIADVFLTQVIRTVSVQPGVRDMASSRRCR